MTAAFRGFLIVMCAVGCSGEHRHVIDAGDGGGSDSGDAGESDSGDAGESDSGYDGGSDAGISPCAIDPAFYDGLQAETLALLANPCDIDVGATTMTLSVRGGETAHVSLRVADNMVIANGQTAGMAECAVPATYTIRIIEDAANPGVERAFLDYCNGLFATGAAAPGITVAVGAGSSLLVRGSSGADKMYLGSTYNSTVLDHSFVNVNDDASPDVQFDGVTAIKVTTGPGADIISADGGNGTTGSSIDGAIAFSAYGSGDADTLTGGKGASTLVGGNGDDLFLQTLTVAADTIVGGTGVDTVDYGVRTAVVTATVCTTCVAGPGCGVCVGDDGASGEGDTIHDDVEGVFGGKGDDLLSARWAVCSNGAATPTIGCTLEGNNGNDTLQGSLFSDTLIGGAGFDTATYSEHVNPVKVSLGSAPLWVAGQNGEAGENDSIAIDVENLTGGPGNDFLRGSAAANIVRGGLGNDTIEGGLGNDALYGDANDDAIYGSTGNDMLVGGSGSDTLVGGDGDDFLDSTDGPANADTVIECDGVNDSSNTAGTAAGTSDALVKDGSDTGALNCEL